MRPVDHTRIFATDDGAGGLTARNAYPKAEFLASTDERFRPVNLLSAADMRGAKRRDFDDLVPETHVREMKAPPDQPAIAEQLLHLVRVGVGGDIEVFRAQAQQQVADRAADQECLIAGLFQPVQNFERVRRDVGPRNRVLITWHDPWAACIA